MIDDQDLGICIFDRRTFEYAVRDAERAAGRGHVNMIRLDAEAVIRLGHGHCRLPGQEFRQHAWLSLVEMGDYNEGNTRVGRHGGEKLLKGFETAR